MYIHSYIYTYTYMMEILQYIIITKQTLKTVIHEDQENYYYKK